MINSTDTSNNPTSSNVHMADLSRATANAVADAVATASDVNTFKEYDTALTIPAVEGYRAVKCLYKKNAKTGKAAGTNSFVRIADHITSEAVTDKLAGLMPYLITYLQEEENKVVKAKHVAGATIIDPDTISLDSIIAALESSGTNNRLNKERVEEWFAGSMLESLMVAFADKMGLSDEPTQAELDKLEQITGVYKAKFASLASGKTSYRPEEAELMLKALDVTGAGTTEIGGRFVVRLERMKTVSTDDLMLSL